MKTTAKEDVTLGILDCIITVEAEVEEKYNQLIIKFCQRVDSALMHEVRIPCVDQQSVLELADKIKKIAKSFPKS